MMNVFIFNIQLIYLVKVLFIVDNIIFKNVEDSDIGKISSILKL